MAQRWVDLDAQGHVNNAAVLDYLQEARVAYLSDSPNAHLLGNGIVVVGQQVEYLAPLGFGVGPLTAEVAVGEVGASRFTIAYTLHEGGLLAVRARTTLCLFDFASGRPTRLAPAERAWFAEQAVPLEPLRDVGGWHVGGAAHEHPVAVRWSDIDRYGHVNNTLYFDYVAEARVALYGALLDAPIRTGTGETPERTWLVARQDLTHTRQMVFRREPYVVRTAIGALGRTSSTLAAQIVDPVTGDVAARAVSVVVHGDAHGQPTPLPEPLHAAAARWPAVPSTRAGGRP
ncbi:acyl-CoA thioesterase [Propioniciclava soli]|uniref:acyl-CoA thioesterase n=1 Tax=Propioniciclava soli TaxID=2775081 RepID=UPI001E636A59